LARCYIKEHKYKEAEDIYHKALNSLPRDAETSGTRQRFLLALGCLYDDERNFSAAAPVLQEALGLAIHNCGPESSDLAPYLRKLGYTLYYLGRKGEMEQYKARASYIVGDTELARPVEYEQPMKAEAKSLGNTQ
jgi:tetratricopeptide (TPR) repeat protein